MRPPNQKQAAAEIDQRLAELFDQVPQRKPFARIRPAARFPYAISIGDYRFLPGYRGSASASSVTAAIDELRNCTRSADNSPLPLLVVPYMGATGRRLCDQSRVAWMDLCGNAKIVAPGLKIWIEGRPNAYRAPGRPPNLFASKSSRIARQLLLDPWRFQTQAELARSSELDDGYVSKIVRRLIEEQYLEVNTVGAVRARDPYLLLDAWRDAYDFSRHRIIQGHVPSRTGEETLRRVAQVLSGVGLAWGATGLSAAWLYTHFAGFRVTSVYLASMPSESLIDDLEFSPEPQGANLWIIVPADDGVFQGTTTLEGIPCVSAVQAYLDLKSHPERAKEAAQELRDQLFPGRRHGE